MSLAKLDEVKTHVYNMGITDPSKLKAQVGTAAAKAGVEGVDSKPPLTPVNSQIHHAW